MPNSRWSASPEPADSSRHSNGLAQVTSFTRSAPSIFGIERACSTSAAGSTGPVAITPRMTPADRSTRVSARVSMSAMATMPCLTRYSRSVLSARQLLARGDASRITNPATCGPRDSSSPSATP